MSWQFFLFVNIITFSITTLLQKILVRESSSKPISYAIFFQFFTGVVVSIVGFALHAMRMPSIAAVWPNLLLGTFLYAFANVFIFKALKQTEASKFTVIFSTRVLFTILASTILLGEIFTGKDIIGALFIFAGIILVSLKSNKFHFGKGDFYGFIAAVLFGFANSNARFILQAFSVYPYMMFVFFTPALLLGIIYPKEIKEAKVFLKGKVLTSICLLSLIYGIANIGFFEALKRGPSSSLVSTIQLLSVIVTVLLAILFLNERKNLLKKLLGTVISFIGLLILSIK